MPPAPGWAFSSPLFRSSRALVIASISPSNEAAMRKVAFIGFIIGVVLGSLFGAVMDVSPGRGNAERQEMLSVNATTGKPQLHIKGKPEIK